MLDHGVWAEVIVADQHLRLFAEHNAIGLQASVYNVTTKLGLRLLSPWTTLSKGSSEPPRMPSNTSDLLATLNCRPCGGRNRGPRRLDSPDHRHRSEDKGFSKLRSVTNR